MVKAVVFLSMEENYRMSKPYIICHMMMSVDGRIDCAMTSKLPGVEDYYLALSISAAVLIGGLFILNKKNVFKKI